ncbi:semaphorin [Eastern grey kangaroopox virus]|uniref:Semaphorin n=1 Tax=Eastern grey kangaroopox virus TaxID=2042482 RepID=A0A2C9DSX0_9POXV|nr:semaphorin [Eastern grey kangaroopox virus]ATI21103.1 semaphorin [Eastern grey kangaroopox virus]ATX75007.1 semaphorin [Eastern grey kangaroopox virus]
MLWRNVTLIVLASSLTLFSQAARVCSKVNPRTYFRSSLNYSFESPEERTSLYEGLDGTIYVGGDSVLYMLGRDGTNLTVQIPSGISGPGNFISTVYENGSGVLLCGTNFGDPRCWNLLSDGNLSLPVSGVGYAPFDASSRKRPLLFCGNDLYTTHEKKGTSRDQPNLRRNPSGGRLSALYLGSSSFSGASVEPVFLMRAKCYSVDAIYYLFNELSDRTMPMLGRVCAEDLGGASSLSRSRWSTFLKARMECRFGDRTFDRVEDASQLLWEDMCSGSDDASLYVVLSDAWNRSAVCAYPLSGIERLFEHSPLKGFSGAWPETRPGECLSSSTPHETATLADTYPELDSPLEGIPLFYSKYHYTHLVAFLGPVSNTTDMAPTLLILATAGGDVHKLVLRNGRVTNVFSWVAPGLSAETSASASVTSMSMLLSLPAGGKSPVLYVASRDGVSWTSLDSACSRYSGGCLGCMQSGDPYCRWNGTSCVSVYEGTGSVVGNERCNYDEPIISASKAVSGSRHYLTCPVESHHAEYAWQLHNRTLACVRPRPRCFGGHGGQTCLLLLANVSASDRGNYSCLASEDGGTRTMLVKQVSVESGPEDTCLSV